ncbi:MAG: hypothetical protein QOI35_2671, partial [Cryptosporangiaceae bacterium]|nr:hypothetical protein [Cryptosporangiaceae bacterium]
MPAAAEKPRCIARPRAGWIRPPEPVTLGRVKRPTTTIAYRYRGPARSGNGGYTAGVLADALLSLTGDDAATVTLRVPPPLDTAMETVPFGGGVQLWHRAVLVAEAVPGTFTGKVTEPVPFAVAAEAA